MKKKIKVYKSMDEFAREFAILKKFNTLVPHNVLNLWDSIVKFASDSMDLGAEGNSGEFHDPDDEKQLREALKQSTARLIKNFEETTGYRPFFVKCNKVVYIKQAKREQYGIVYEGAWDFKNVL